MASLLLDSLQRCQADASTIFGFISTAFAAILNFKPQTPYNNELLTSLIISSHLFKAFPKQVFSFGSQTFKKGALIIQLVEKSREKYADFITEALNLILSVSIQPDSCFERKDREAVISIIGNFLKEGEYKFAGLSAKIYCTLLKKVKLEKKHVYSILEKLNGPLSYSLFESGTCFHLMEVCFSYSASGKLNPTELNENIRRVQRSKVIDCRLASVALGNVLAQLEWSDKDLENVFLLLMSGSKTLSIEAFTPNSLDDLIIAFSRKRPIREAVEFLFRLFTDKVIKRHSAYGCAFLRAFRTIFQIESSAFDDSMFVHFEPLTSPHEDIQIAAITLITEAFLDRPADLCNQIAVIFGQLKGDFLRIEQGDTAVDRAAVAGLLKLFVSLLQVNFVNFPEYAEIDLLKTIMDWSIDRSRCIISSNAAESSIDVLITLSVIASLLISHLKSGDYNPSKALLTSLPISRIHLYLPCYVNLISMTDESTLCENLNMFERYIEHLNTLPVAELLPLPLYSRLPIVGARLLDCRVPASRLNSVTSLFAKLLAFCSYAAEIRSTTNLIEPQPQASLIEICNLFAKLFWKASDEARTYCLKFWSAAVKNDKNAIFAQILLALKAVVYSGDNLPDLNLFEMAQKLCQHFVGSEFFVQRVNVGECLGGLVNLIPAGDSASLDALFDQMCKYSLDTSSKSRTPYIIGLGVVLGVIRSKHIKCSQSINPQAFFGILSSMTHEVKDSEIFAAALISMSQFVDICGSGLSADFYRDFCGLVLEQVFLHKHSFKVSQAIKESIKSLALYSNVVKDASHFTEKTIQVILDSSYFDGESGTLIHLLHDLQSINPATVSLTLLLCKNISQSISQGNFIKSLRTFIRAMEINPNCGMVIMDSGVWMSVLSKADECSKTLEFRAMLRKFLLMLIKSTSLHLEQFWLDEIFGILFSGPKAKQKTIKESLSMVEEEDLVSKSAFSVSDLKLDGTEMVFSEITSSIVFEAVVESELGSINDQEFVAAAMKYIVSINSEHSESRHLVVSSLMLLNRILQSGSLKSYDNQIVAVLSSYITDSVDDMITCSACRCIFSMLQNREDLRESIFTGNARLTRLLGQMSLVLKERLEIGFKSVHRDKLMCVIVGFCGLSATGVDLSCVNVDLSKELSLKVEALVQSETTGDSISVQERLSIAQYYMKTGGKARIEEYIMACLEDESTCSSALDVIVAKGGCSVAVIRKCLETSFGCKALAMVFDRLAGKDLKVISEELRQINVRKTRLVHGQGLMQLGLVLNGIDVFGVDELVEKYQDFVQAALDNFDEAFSKPILLLLKSILQITGCETKANALISFLLAKVQDIVKDSFLVQMITFALCSRPDIWHEEKYHLFSELIREAVKMGDSEHMQVVVENWILLIKTRAKDGNPEKFILMVDSITGLILDDLKSKEISEGLRSILTASLGFLQNSLEFKERLEAILNK